MSAIEYNNLLFEISQRFDELNVHSRLLFMCRGKLASGSEDDIQDALSLFKELEEQNNLEADRLEVIKGLLKSFKEWSLFGKVRKLESKRKKYNELLELIIGALDELNDVERLISMCRGKISEESEGNIQDVRSLIKELVSRNILGYDRLDILKGILNEIEKSDLVKEVEEFEEQRNQEDEIERKEDEFERRKAQAAAVVSSVGNTLIGVLNIKTVFKVVAGGITVVSTLEVLSRWSTFDQLVTAVNSCVLPAGTSLVQLTDGCVCLTVRAETLSALVTLWKLYQDGTLETRLYDFFVTDKVRERAGGEEVELTVTVEEQEYKKACLELIYEAQEAASSAAGERIRRNSDSAVYFRPKKEPTLIKLKHAETELKFHKERIAVIERETGQISLDILEACSPEEKTALLKQIKIWKEREAGEMGERTDEPEISRLNKAKLMDPGKYAFVQKYLEDVQETRSMTTEASDSGLATHAAASDFGTEEISETNKLRLKDMTEEVTHELSERLEYDQAATEKFYQYFGLKMQDRFEFLGDIENFFPDTTISALKECFENLQLYDLAELLEKVRPRVRSLRPALSPEEIEKLQNDRPTKYHSNVAVLIVNHSDKCDITDRDSDKKIETFFKDLNSQNEVVIASTISKETRGIFWKIKENKEEEKYLQQEEKRKRHRLDIELREERERLEKAMKKRKGRGQSSRVYYSRKGPLQIEQEETRVRHELDMCMKKGANLREQRASDIKKIKELEKETERAISTVVDKWIQNQDKFTCVAVFVMGDTWCEDIIAEKFALIPDHAKLLVSPYGWENIGNVSETLHVTYPRFRGHMPIFSWMAEIFNKRWQTLDVTSMMKEVKRTCYWEFSDDWFFDRNFTIKDNLSTCLRFNDTEEKSS